MFTIEEVTKIAKLSALELTPEEKEKYATQFSTILDYFKVLNSLDIAEETGDRDESHLDPAREDKAHSPQVSPDQFSPYIENNSFKVPKVIDAS